MLPASAPRRLTFHPNGTLTEPGGKPILLRGFTFDYKRGPHGGHSQKNVTDEDRQVSKLLPNTNFARLVMVHWHDEPTRHHGDCASDDPALGFLNQPCLDQFDRIIKWAAKRMWVTITARASLAAGDGAPGRTIFNNATLRKQMVSMWGFLARRYAGHDHIAGYEVMSEPRVGDASAVHAFHLTACHHVWKGDPAAGCFVGPTKFYDRTHLSSAYLIADARVVYAANMFDYVEGTDAGEVRAALLRKLGMISNFSTTFSVPVWVDQWGVQDDSPGGEVAHATYLREILQIFGEARFHWSCEHVRTPLPVSATVCTACMRRPRPLLPKPLCESVPSRPFRLWRALCGRLDLAASVRLPRRLSGHVRAAQRFARLRTDQAACLRSVYWAVARARAAVQTDQALPVQA